MVRVLLALVTFTVLYGCGQASSPVEKQEMQKGVEQARKEEPGQEEASREEQPERKTCEDFYGPQDAQAYFDSKATPEEKRTLDADGDGWACNEGKVAWKPEGETTTASRLQIVKASGSDALKALPPEKPITVEDLNSLNSLNNEYDRSIALGLIDCQYYKYAAMYGEQAADEHFDRIVDEAVETPSDEEVVSIQEQMMNEGYTCSLKEITEMQELQEQGGG
jgi:hypothetical protein